MSITPNDATLREYQALGETCGFYRFPQRTILELTGADRVKFLHNFSTADIKRLASGQGTEAFITNVQGKTVGYLYVLVGQDRIVLENAAGQAAALLPHLGKYILLDDAELADRSDAWSSTLVAGSTAAELLREICQCEVPLAMYGNVEFDLEESKAMLAQIGLTGKNCYLVIGENAGMELIDARLRAAGAVSCGAEAVTIRRIEAGSPQYGSEVTDVNLPQEVARDVEAISFTKGCYLGQETVARIDALGHVNRYLQVVRFAGDTVPDIGWEHQLDGKTVLRVTSAAYSPACESPLALAYLRRGHEKIGTHLETELGGAEVVGPLAP